MKPSDCKWTACGTVAIKRTATIGMINARELTATVWTHNPDDIAACVDMPSEFHQYRSFPSIRAAKLWASTEFNRILSRYL